MKIRVDVETLIEKLEAMIEDDYVTAELEIEEDDYLGELHITAIGFDSEPVSYGSISETEDELF